MNLTDIITTNFNIFIFSAAILGLIVGSFLNVVIYRLPTIIKNEQEQFEHKQNTFNLLAPRSHCPHCKNIVTWWQNIPLISYILLRGKCKNCKQPISLRYPIIELSTSIMTILPIIFFGINTQSLSLIILSWMLIPAIFIDFDEQLLPDQLTIPLIWMGLIVNTMHTFTNPTYAIIGAVSGYLFLWTVNKTFKLVRKFDGMGYGDFKLFAAFGAWLGWEMLPIIILISSLIGAVVGISLMIVKKHKLSEKLPFGPFLAITGWLTFFWGKHALYLINTILFA